MDMENVKCSLDRILAAFELILEDMMEEHRSSNGVPLAFYARTENIYLPALDLIYSNTFSLLKDMDAEARA